MRYSRCRCTHLLAGQPTATSLAPWLVRGGLGTRDPRVVRGAGLAGRYTASCLPPTPMHSQPPHSSFSRSPHPSLKNSPSHLGNTIYSPPQLGTTICPLCSPPIPPFQARSPHLSLKNSPPHLGNTIYSAISVGVEQLARPQHDAERAHGPGRRPKRANHPRHARPQ